MNDKAYSQGCAAANHDFTVILENFRYRGIRPDGCRVKDCDYKEPDALFYAWRHGYMRTWMRRNARLRTWRLPPWPQFRSAAKR